MPNNEHASKRSEVLSLFPTFVWETRLAPKAWRSLNGRIKDHLDALIPDLKIGQSWQSSHDLHRLTEFEELAQCINSTAASVLEFLKVDCRDIEITACWATVNAPGRGHAVHAHPNSYFSGVYYAQTHTGADTINFHDPRSQMGVIRPPVTELIAANADQAVVKVSDGTLLFFPSWLQHSVDTNSSDKNRISVSFNLMFSEYTEQLCKPLWGRER